MRLNPFPYIQNLLRVSLPSTGRVFHFSGGTSVSPISAPKASAYYRGVTYISTQIAKLPIYVKDHKNNIQMNNMIYHLLNVRPNPETNAFKFKNYLIQSAINWGNGYAEIERDIYGRPVALWQIEPQRVTPMRTVKGELYYRVDGNESGKTVFLLPKDILIIANIYTEDGIHGIPTVVHAAQALGIALGAEGFANSLYANGALPAGALTHPGVLSDEAYKRLKTSWDEQMSGRKTGGTVILEEGVKYEPVTHSPAVLQFIETRKFSVPEIARFLGVPPIKLFDMDSAKYGNMEQVHLEVATDILDVWAINVEGEVDIKLLSDQRFYKADIDLYSVFRGDMSTRSTYFQKMMQSAALTPNEIRAKEGMAPFVGGDRYFLATNNFTPLDRVDEVLDSQMKDSEATPSETPVVEEEVPSSGDPEVDAILNGLMKKYEMHKEP